MAAQLFYFRDICCLKSDCSKIGVVDRTYADVDTHERNVLVTYPRVTHHASVSRSVFHHFLEEGIPPRNHVLVSWQRLPWQTDTSSILIPETELELLDRELSSGDRVKRNASDAMSGTVVAVDVVTSLVPPRKFPSPGSDGVPQDRNKTYGTFSHRPRDQIHGIPSTQLQWLSHYQEHDIVLYKGWIGRVMELSQEVTIRLANGTVVIPEVFDDVEIPKCPDREPTLGDFVTTKKANLRRGRWIFGAYDPNVDPSGFIVGIVTDNMQVAWSTHYADPAGHQAEEPPEDLYRDELAGPDFFLFPVYRRPCSLEPSQAANMAVKVGDVVRFKDLTAALESYGGGSPAKLQRIPRTETMGYDLNLCVCSGTQTTVLVKWQDLTVTRHATTELTPTLQFDDDDELWPCELVATKENREQDNATYLPNRVGVVQQVDARNRTAMVHWLEGRVSMPRDSPAELLPGSFTGRLVGEPELVSLYDVWTTPALSRNPGDLCQMVQSPAFDAETPAERRDLYRDCDRVFEGGFSDSRSYFGEIVSLNADGRVTVRLNGLGGPQEVTVPVECTLVINELNLDAEEPMPADLDELMEPAGLDVLMDELSGVLDPETFEMVRQRLEVQGPAGVMAPGLIPPALLASATNNAFGGSPGAVHQHYHHHHHRPIPQEPEAPWTDMNNEPVDEEGWQTDDDGDEVDDTDSNMDTGDDDKSSQAMQVDGNHEQPSSDWSSAPPPNQDEHVSMPGEDFGYEHMFADEGPEKMAILEGPVAADHHFLGEQQAGTGQLGRIAKEISSLKQALPDGVYVRTWESAMHLFRILIIGPMDTPYEYAPFVVDMQLHDKWPEEPPLTFFHSITDGTGAINPNLYEDGKICLSLLGTWHGDNSNMTWSKKATLLQIVVSLLGLVLVREPYYNEAGFEVRAGTVEARIPSRLYSERTYFRSRMFIRRPLEVAETIPGLEDVLERVYQQGPRLLFRAIRSAIAVMHRSRAVAASNGDEAAAAVRGRIVSAGAVIPLRRQIEGLITVVKDEAAKQQLQAYLASPAAAC